MAPELMNITFLFGIFCTLWGIVSLIFPNFMINIREDGGGLAVERFLYSNKGKSFFKKMSWFFLIMGLSLLFATLWLYLAY